MASNRQRKSGICLQNQNKKTMDIRVQKNRARTLKTHHERRAVDPNHASEEELADQPMVGKQRARDLIRHRPFSRWEEAEKVPGFSKGMVDDLKSGNAQLGSEQ